MVESPDKTAEKYRKQIAEAWIELRAFEKIRELCDDKIADLRDLIKANANFLPNEERSAENMLLDVYKRPTDIPEAVRLALFLAMGRKERLTPVQIKEEAERRGFSFSGYTNPMASIHTVLKRMKEADPPEVTFDEESGTYMCVRWPTDITQPSFYERISKRVSQRVMSLEAEKTVAIAQEELGSMLDSLSKKHRGKED
jgi:hypothetical protein